MLPALALAACASESGGASDSKVPGTNDGGPPPGAPPNILYVYFDQLRSDASGAAGVHPMLRTPTLDVLAKQSVRFTRAYTASQRLKPRTYWFGSSRVTGNA